MTYEQLSAKQMYERERKLYEQELAANKAEVMPPVPARNMLVAFAVKIAIGERR